MSTGTELVSKESAEAASIIVPGRIVALKSEEGLTATVYPIGFRHLQRFTKVVLEVADNIALSLQKLETKEESLSDEQRNAVMLQQLAPMLLREGLSLVGDCVVIEGDRWKIDHDDPSKCLPHWDIAVLVGAWIEENFGDESLLDPWKATFEDVKGKLTKIPAMMKKGEDGGND